MMQQATTLLAFAAILLLALGRHSCPRWWRGRTWRRRRRRRGTARARGRSISGRQVAAGRGPQAEASAAARPPAAGAGAAALRPAAEASAARPAGGAERRSAARGWEPALRQRTGGRRRVSPPVRGLPPDKCRNNFLDVPAALHRQLVGARSQPAAARGRSSCKAVAGPRRRSFRPDPVRLRRGARRTTGRCRRCGRSFAGAGVAAGADPLPAARRRMR